MVDGRPQTQADELHLLLPWYANGTLSADEIAAFEGHLQLCAACRDEMRFVERLRNELTRHGEVFLEDHPPADRLVASARGELDPEAERLVRRHLSLCATCAAETRWITGQAVADAPPTAPAPRARPGRSWLPWAAAAAAAVCGFLLATALRGPMSTDALPVALLSEASRGAPVRVALTADRDSFMVTAPFDFGRDVLPAELTFLDRADRVVRSGRITVDALVQNRVFIPCLRDDFPDGRYRLQIAPPGLPPLSFEFEVVTLAGEATPE